MKKAYTQLHIAIILAGFTGLFGKLITLNEGLISWYRMLMSGIILLITLLVAGRLQRISTSVKLRMALMGTILGLQWLFFYGSIKYSNISVGVVCYALTSFFNAILAPMINKKKLSVQELFLSGLTLVGIGLIFGMDASFRTGILLGILSSIFAALYTVYNERFAQQYKGETIILYQMLGGFLGLSLVMPVFLAISPAKSLLPSATDFGWLLVLSGLCTVVMYLLVIKALKYISSFTLSLSFNLEPLYTILLAMLIYKESKVLTIWFYTGSVLIFASVIIQMFQLKNERLSKRSQITASP